MLHESMMNCPPQDVGGPQRLTAGRGHAIGAQYLGKRIRMVTPDPSAAYGRACSADLPRVLRWCRVERGFVGSATYMYGTR